MSKIGKVLLTVIVLILAIGLWSGLAFLSRQPKAYEVTWAYSTFLD